MNPNSTLDLKRLADARKASRQRLKPFRENRYDAIRQVVGSHYGNDGAPDDVPVGFLELATSVYVQQLVGSAPRAYTSTMVPELKYAAADLKLALDYAAERMHLEETFWRVTQDALFCCGITKMGLTQGELGSNNWWNTAWQPFLDWIDMDDWVHDMAAKTWESIAFCGNRYRLDLQTVRECSLFDKKVREKLQASLKATTTEAGDRKAETIGGGLGVDQDEYRDQVELWDIWLPREKLVVTVPADDDESKPLRVVEWNGPDGGPYDMLGFNVVPSNIMPLPPVAIWTDLHNLGNELYRKLSTQALRQKSMLPFRAGSEEDVENARDANDGDAFRCDGELPREVRLGGPDQVNLAFFLGLNELFNRFTGNLDTLGGLSPAADTLGQEQILGANASQRVIFMRRKFGAFVDRIFTKLAHYLYNDPLVNIPLEKRVQGTDVSVPFSWNPETRIGHADLFKVAIEPYSNVYRTPESQMAAVMQIWQQIIAPAAPLIPPGNLVQAITELLRMCASLRNLPELNDLIPLLVAAPQQPMVPGQPGGQGGQTDVNVGMPAVTTRNYVRQNIPGASRSQKENALAQALLGSMPQPAESAAMMRSTG